MTPTRRTAIWLSAAVLVGVLFRLYFALRFDTLIDGYHNWWIAAHFARTGSYIDPFATKVGSEWLPGYHFLAAGLLLMAGTHALLTLRILNVFAGGASVAVVGLIGRRRSDSIGIVAAFLYALAPWEAVTSARSLPESMAWLLCLLAVFFILEDVDANHRLLGAGLLAVACAFRYEPWLLAVILGVRQVRISWTRASQLVPAGAVMGAWALVTFVGNSWFLGRLYQQNHAEASYHERIGLYSAEPFVRVAHFYGFYFAAAALVWILALVVALRRPARLEVVVAAAFLGAVSFLVAASASDGSVRYVALAVPFVCLLAAEAIVTAVRRWRVVGVAALAALFILQGVSTVGALQGNKSLSIYEAPARRAGAWISEHPPRAGSVLISESPAAAYWSGVDPGHVLGSKVLPLNRTDALAYLRANVDLIVYVNNTLAKYPYYHLNAVFPELRNGTTTPEFQLVYDANGWETQYGAREVYVYEVRHG